MFNTVPNTSKGSVNVNNDDGDDDEWLHSSILRNLDKKRGLPFQPLSDL